MPRGQYPSERILSSDPASRFPDSRSLPRSGWRAKEASGGRYPLHPRDVAPRLRVPHVEVSHRLVRQQPLDRAVHLAVHDPLPGHDPAIRTVGFEGQGQIAQRGRKAFLIVVRTVLAMDEDGSRGRVGVQPSERVVGEEDTVLLAFAELLEAEAAGAVAARRFDVGGVAVAGRFQGGPDLLREGFGNGNDAVGAHGSPSRPASYSATVESTLRGL